MYCWADCGTLGIRQKRAMIHNPLWPPGICLSIRFIPALRRELPATRSAARYLPANPYAPGEYLSRIGKSCYKT